MKYKLITERFPYDFQFAKYYLNYNDGSLFNASTFVLLVLKQVVTSLVISRDVPTILSISNTNLVQK